MLGGAAGRTVCSAGLSFFSAFLLEKPVSIRGHAVGVVFFFPKPLFVSIHRARAGRCLPFSVAGLPLGMAG